MLFAQGLLMSTEASCKLRELRLHESHQGSLLSKSLVTAAETRAGIRWLWGEGLHSGLCTSPLSHQAHSRITGAPGPILPGSVLGEAQAIHYLSLLSKARCRQGPELQFGTEIFCPSVSGVLRTACADL